MVTRDKRIRITRRRGRSEAGSGAILLGCNSIAELKRGRLWLTQMPTESEERSVRAEGGRKEKMKRVFE